MYVLVIVPIQNINQFEMKHGAIMQRDHVKHTSI